MTPEEIRGISDHGEVVATFLREIAAQLAELNRNYEDFKKSFTSNACIDVKTWTLD